MFIRYLLLFIVFLFSFAAVSPRNFIAQESFIRTEKKHFKSINKMHKKGKTGKRFVLVQTADAASFQEDPARPGQYQLVLHEIDPYIQFYKAQPSKSYGIIFMRQYVWFCKIGKNAFLKCRRGALGYLSAVQGAEQGSSLHQVFELTKPKYVKKENKLIYEIAQVEEFNFKKQNLKEVTLVIDLSLN